jgi:hypothetical protein
LAVEERGEVFELLFFGERGTEDVCYELIGERDT